MPKKKIFPLYTRRSLADRWGVSKQIVNNWATRDSNFCKPVDGYVVGYSVYYPYHEVERYEKLKGLTPREPQE